MKISMSLEPEIGPKWHYAREMGIEEVVAIRDAGPEVPIWDYLTFARVQKFYEDFGFKIGVIEGWVPMDNIRLGRPEGEAELERLIAVIEHMGALGIEVFCYSWMAINSWTRTSTTTRTRGGALTTTFDNAVVAKDPRSHGPVIVSEEHLWETLAAFLERVLPVAERAGVKLAMHPDDPPLSPFLGVGRIMSSVENFERLLKLSDSPANGITFCQANFAAMNADVPATIRRFGADGRMHFVHFRDIEGDAHKMSETFHDAGKTDMYASIKAYRDIGFTGLMRPDHAPVMWGEPNSKPGYEALGRIFAVGYMRGLVEAARAEAAERS
ncbi:mannonate dehydratase [Jiella sp. MQZ9-1]|uniref:mannonate dehydratase n=1 Tax=Jiella flava TaxID=2816857 RepID=A0A939FWU7_9HYPH|nr:mannonate dehydratase [Jiella flava]MBO0660977.1 mannonate dehydratase [Jiella flava]MCD2469625.1 mannonate dehydratase [Jiella flava]